MAEQINHLIEKIAQKARHASFELTTLSKEKKNQILETLANLLESNVESILQSNAKDIAMAENSRLENSLIDRLCLTKERIAAMAQGVRKVIQLPDPVNEEIERIQRPNGLDIRKVRAPIGVIGIIYESRPNVTIDCAILCLKSGNASILRGGKEAFYSNSALASLVQQALQKNHVTTHAVQLIPTTDRAALNVLLRLNSYIHCIIPRGGEALIDFVTKNSLIPVIKHYKGVCNIYMDKSIDADMAEKLLINSKCQRPGVCNAAENLFIHEAICKTLLPRIARSLIALDVEIRVDQLAAKVLTKVGIPFKPAKEADFFEEYLDKILAIKVVSSLEEAIEAVNTYGSQHSDLIITTDKEAAKKFMSQVDSSTVYWNASTRFTDGFEFGLGAEIGISTDKLHARGPMGLRELCTYKYFVFGSGQVK
jgi:glutamate-5-semialdehyde dehydrogenase